MPPTLMTLMLLTMILMMPQMLLKMIMDRQTPKIPVFIEKHNQYFKNIHNTEKPILKKLLMPLW